MARFVQIIEFQTSRIEELEELGRQENCSRPETSDLAAKMAALRDSPPVFRNLDVMWEDTDGAAGHS